VTIDAKTDNTIPVADMLDHLAVTARKMEEAGEGFGCVVVLLVDRQGGWAGGVGGEQALDLAKLLLNTRDSLIAGEKSFTLFTKREKTDAPSEPMLQSSNPQLPPGDDDG
jgi:hypothetical protein